MADIALVACAKTKAKRPAPAAALYVSALYRKSLLAALDRTKAVYILSAKHGLVSLDDILEPYEMTLKTMPSTTRRAWGATVAEAIRSVAKRRDQLLLFAGEDYAAPLREPLQAQGYLLQYPLGTRSLGARLQHLRELNGEAVLEAALPRFDGLIRKLSRAQDGGRRIADCHGRQPWPERGLYFVTEDVGPGGRRMVTRVGTHAVSVGSRTTLWDRVSTHRGAGHGGGSHRSSIFRAHVGRALSRRAAAASVPPSWGVGASAPSEIRAGEAELERRVSEKIGDMRLLWLDVPDAPGPRSDRAYLERNIIGLLSRANLLGARVQPDPIWLGADSSDWRIVVSGLWNLDHLFHRPDPAFLDVLESFVQATTSGKPPPRSSIAPAAWGVRQEARPATQLKLFETSANSYGGT
ncbi:MULTISPECIES: DUF6884 domain-containing protein [unclassified Phenylobacterium]|uniref:DUF6884 domain-containing protein n=1 Tax=unclassified Phenylobacterium TaxID=2640670 RepID=UPI000B193E24|nr:MULTISPECIES: DUF6884 domain-containing protein [unclassified Phenylobacterium]